MAPIRKKQHTETCLSTEGHTSSQITFEWQICINLLI